MTKAGLLLACVLMFGFGDCSNSPVAGSGSNPAWVDQLIKEFKAAPVGNPPRAIYKYDYQGTTVYYLPAQCCDQLSTLYDADGKVLCAPDGGLTGHGDGKCSDFFQARANEAVVWKDARTK